MENKIIQIGELGIKGYKEIKAVYSIQGLSPTLNTMGGAIDNQKYY